MSPLETPAHWDNNNVLTTFCATRAPQVIKFCCTWESWDGCEFPASKKLMHIKDVTLIFPAGCNGHSLFLNLPTQTPVTGCDGAELTLFGKLVFIRAVMGLIIADLDNPRLLQMCCRTRLRENPSWKSGHWIKMFHKLDQSSRLSYGNSLDLFSRLNFGFHSYIHQDAHLNNNTSNTEDKCLDFIQHLAFFLV